MLDGTWVVRCCFKSATNQTSLDLYFISDFSFWRGNGEGNSHFIKQTDVHPKVFLESYSSGSGKKESLIQK